MEKIRVIFDVDSAIWREFLKSIDPIALSRRRWKNVVFPNLISWFKDQPQNFRLKLYSELLGGKNE